MKDVLALRSYGLKDIDLISEKIIDFAGEAKIWLFIGEMGAGKTTLIKSLCKRLEVVDSISSPTFSIVNEYLTKQDETVYHFDFYRIEEIEEAEAIGAEDYFFSGNLCLIEWPQIIADLLPDEYMTIRIEEELNGERAIKLEHHG